MTDFAPTIPCMAGEGDDFYTQALTEGWRLPRPETGGGAGREPGAFNLHRYVFSGSATGIRTFFGAPICLTPDDLRAAQADIAIAGVPCDMSLGMRGAAQGPHAVRSGGHLLSYSPMSYVHQHVDIDIFSELNVVDYGDAPVDPLSTERSVPMIRQFVREIVEAGVVPMLVGGDHSIAWPNIAAMADVYGPGKVGVVHFDAHADASDQFFGHLASHGSPIRRLVNDEHIPGSNFVQVGLRGFYPDSATQNWMIDNGLKTHFMAEVERYGFDKVMDVAIDQALSAGAEHLYISLDIDVLDPAFAPGTGTPEPAGLTPRELFPMLRRLTHEVGIVGAELVEVNPFVDPGYTTGLTANRCLVEMITGHAMRKLGLPGPHYLDSVKAGDQWHLNPENAPE